MRSFTALVAALALALLGAGNALADHAWGDYHWERSSNPRQLTIASNLTTASWDSHLGSAVADWEKSTVLSLSEGDGAGLKNCGPVAGRVEVCNDRYGYRNGGWLGVAQIWLSGSHIVQGVVKLNDTFLTDGSYDSPAWRQMVMCQEVGHTFGLDHQDEDFYNSNLGTCMDYTDDPSSNQHPNSHDYEQLESIYAHTDGGSGGGGGDDGNCPPRNPHCGSGATSAPSFSQASRANGSFYVDRVGRGMTRITHVLWAAGER